MIPDKLEKWTLEAIATLIRQRVLEVGSFDFKGKLPPSRGGDDSKFRLRKTLAGFANTRGGFLIFGVSDNKELEPEERLIGIDPNLEFFEHFQALAAGCTPSIDWTPRVPSLALEDKGTLIHVIQIHEGKRKPFGVLVDKEYWVFPKRTEGGSTEPLSYSEILDGFRDQRMVLASLKRMKIEADRMVEHGRQANIEAQGYREPNDLFRLFRPGPLEAASIHVLGYVDTGEMFPRCLGDLLSAANAADLELERLRGGNGGQKLLINLVLQALNAASNLGKEIDALLARLS